MLATLAGLALACQLPSGSNRENRDKSTGTSRPALATPKSPEPAPVAENTTAGAVDETAAAPVPCATTEFKYPAVQAACSDGGRNSAKKIMQGAIAKAKRAGTELKCASCHIDQKNFGLRPNAVDDLASWL
jgi:hypothetical protein